jgi:hypothetical protein
MQHTESKNIKIREHVNPVFRENEVKSLNEEDQRLNELNTLSVLCVTFAVLVCGE